MLRTAAIKNAVDAQGAVSLLSGVEKEHVTLDESQEEFDSRIFDHALRSATRSLYMGGHYRLAILEAYKYVNNLVKEKTKSTADGSGLMKTVFSLSNPKLALNDLNSKSKQDEQLGYMDIFAGVMTGIRNPRAHETKWPDDQKSAIELLTFAEHLISKVNSSVVKRQRRNKKSSPSKPPSP